MSSTTPSSTPSETSFPSADAMLTLDALLEDFARCARIDDVRAELPPATVEVLRKDIAREGRTAAQRERFVATMFRKGFDDVNRALADRRVDAAWTCFYTSNPDGSDRVRWYRMTAAQARDFEATGALTMATLMRRSVAGLMVAAVFYVLLWQAWARKTTALYVAAGVALAAYFVFRWRFPLRPKA